MCFQKHKYRRRKKRTYSVFLDVFSFKFAVALHPMYRSWQQVTFCVITKLKALHFTKIRQQNLMLERIKLIMCTFFVFLNLHFTMRHNIIKIAEDDFLADQIIPALATVH